MPSANHTLGTYESWLAFLQNLPLSSAELTCLG